VHAIAVRDREKQRTEARPRRRRLWVLGTALAGAVLFFCYLRVAGATAGATEVVPDGVGQLLQASDMLHGNLLLHGWWTTDVSFITTEMPEYMAVTAIAGVRPEVVHVCAALTYTLLVLLAAFVARGRARGPEGVVRALLAAGVMLAPEPAGSALVLLGSPDHVGTALPLLALLLLLDRAPNPRSRARWYIPVCGVTCIATATLLAWTIVGDPLVEVVGVVPLAIACLVRVVRISATRLIRARRLTAQGDGDLLAASPGAEDPAAGDNGAADTSWRAACYQLLLAGAAVAAVPLAQLGNSLIRSHHGYQLGPNLYHRQPWHVIASTGPVFWRNFLMLFGADYADVSGARNVAVAWVHLAGVAVVIAGLAFGGWRLLVPARAARAGDLVADFLLLAVGLNIAGWFAFIPPSHVLFSAHEIGPVVAFGAALAGRVLGGPLLSLRLAAPDPGREQRLLASSPRKRGAPVLVAVLAAWLACYAALLGVAAASRQVPPENATLAAWLSGHQLRSGLSSYWDASSVTVDTRGKVTLVAVTMQGPKRLLGPVQWETDPRLANPATHRANFVVAGPDPFRKNLVKLAVRMFGKPVRTYRYGAYLIMVWNKNLLDELGPG
jgi:hypothetical protein